MYGMRKIYYAMVFLLLSFAGCTRDENRSLSFKEGVPVPTDLAFNVEGAELYTKAEQSVLIENRVRNLYVMQFSSSGEVLSRGYYTVGSGGTVVSYFEKADESDGASSGIIPNYPALSGADCRFLAFANINSTVRSDLENVSTYSGIEEMVYTMTVSGNIERNFFLMTASEEDVDVDDDPDTPLGINLVLKRIDAKVTFSVDINIDEATEGPVFSNLYFKVHNVPNSSYLISRSRPANAAAGTENTWDALSGSYGTMAEYANFDSVYVNNKGGRFSFYVMENRPLPKREITPDVQGDYPNLYAMREAWWEEGTETAAPVSGREFIYAPDAAAYVEILGHLEYTRLSSSGEPEYVNADVVYIIHLGETGSARDVNDVERVNNYDVRRNVRYNYNVTVTGVNSMIVEVETGVDNRPGNEGDLAISTSREVAFDAHYGRTLFKISNMNLDEASWSSENPNWGTTSKQNGLITFPYDYKWVLFAINSEFGGSNTDDRMVKFPGLHAYDGGVDFFLSDGGQLKPEDQLRAEISSDTGNKFTEGGVTKTFKELLADGSGVYADNYYRNRINTLSDGACLRDINQLINYLQEHPELFNDEGLVYITAFCDEFIYVYDPRRDNYVYQGTPVHEISSDLSDQQRRLGLWKEFVNSQDNRVLNIQPMTSTSVSPDGNTTYTNSYITFSQKPVFTAYNPAVATTAWGLETINETGELNYQVNTSINGTLPNTTGNGRQNFINFFINGSNQSDTRFDWTDLMTTETDVEDENGLNPQYRNLIYACLSRNRDLNGNNHIDPSELLWYLASIDQLTTMFIAQDALSQDQWLYTGDGKERHHVVSSSYRNTNSFSQSAMWLLWAEEGASRGDVQGSLNTLEYNGYTGSYEYDYRCVRNLGIDISNVQEEPEHYAEYERTYDNASGGWVYTIDLGRLSPSTYRTAYDDGDILPLTHERTATDKPFSSFQVKENYESSASRMTWLEMRDALNNNSNPCPDGWRVPNLREMLIIISTLNGEHGDGHSLTWPDFTQIATSYSFNGVAPNYSGNDRYGFRYDYPNIRLLDEASANGSYEYYEWKKALGYFRCVRDYYPGN